MRLLQQARSVLRLLQVLSDAVDLLERAIRKELPKAQVATPRVNEVTPLHLLFHDYNGHWPTDRRELAEFASDMGFG